MSRDPGVSDTEWGHPDALVSDCPLEGGCGERGAGRWPRGPPLDLSSSAPGLLDGRGSDPRKVSTFQSDTCGHRRLSMGRALELQGPQSEAEKEQAAAGAGPGRARCPAPPSSKRRSESGSLFFLPLIAPESRSRDCAGPALCHVSSAQARVRAAAVAPGKGKACAVDGPRAGRGS